MNGSVQIQLTPGAGQDDALAGLRGILRVTRPDADVELIRRAYEVAAFWHRGQARLSGDPYITHPLAVAAILAEVGADDQMLCAALLHDTTEDTPCTLAELSREFGADVAALVAGTTALDQTKGRGRKMTRGLAAARSTDSRVLAIKVADRLHNMRTVEFIAHAKQLRKSRESLDFFAPVASRLRMGTIGTELEALAYATLKRNRHVRSVPGRLLVMMTALLPAASRTRWCEEWLGELHTLPARRDRVSFALHAVLGIPRLAVLARRPVPGQRQAG